MDEERVAVRLVDEHHPLVDLFDGRRLGRDRHLDGIGHERARELPDDAALCCYCGRILVRKPQSKIHQRPNGTGTAFQRKGQKTWTAQYTVPTGWFLDENGKRHRKRKTKGGFKTKADALNYIETLRSDAEKKPAPPLSDYWKLYSEGDMLKLGPDKITAYKGAWKKMESIAYRKIGLLCWSEHLSS